MAHIEKEASFTTNDFLPSVYTAAHFFSGIPLVKQIMLFNVSDDLEGDLSISIHGENGGIKVLSFSLAIPDFQSKDYLCAGSGTVTINLEKHKILPNEKFINSLEINTSVRISVDISIGEKSRSCSSHVRFSPFGHVCPEMPPELLCTYVLPNCEFAAKAFRRLSSQVKKEAEKQRANAPLPLLYAQALSSIMLEAKLTYSPSFREMLDGDCIIRDPDSLTTSNKRSMSQTEAALLYCSCAERCSLHPSIIFLRKGAGSVKVLIGITLGDYYASTAVSESISELRERILDKELFVFDVLGLLGTEDTDFVRNVTETTNLVLKGSSTLAFSVDVFTARLCGVNSLRPYDGIAAKDIYGGYESIKDVLKRIEKSDSIQSLYGYSPYSGVSVGVCADYKSLQFGKKYTITALDDEILCTDPDSFSLLTSFPPKGYSGIPRNNTQLADYEAKSSEFVRKVLSAPKREYLYAYPSRYMLSGEKLTPVRIRDELISDTLKLSEIVSNDSLYDGKAAIYAAVGIVKITEENNTYYSPAAYVPCDIKLETGLVQLRFGTGRAIFNRSLYDYVCGIAGADFSKKPKVSQENSDDLLALLPDERFCELCTFMEIYENIPESFSGQIEYTPDIFLCAFDLSYTMMRDCLERSDGKLFETFLESGKYANAENMPKNYGRFERTLPFETSLCLRNAVKAAESNSIVISGVHGTGKKKAVANLISRAALSEKDILVTSKYSESLDSLYDTLCEEGLGELCLVIRNSEETKKQISADIEKLLKKPEYPTFSDSDDISALEGRLDNYSDELYSEQSFGMSLYDCIDSYCKAELLNDEAPLKIGGNIGDLSSENAGKLFDTAADLKKIGAKLQGIAVGKPDCALRLFRYIKTTEPIGEKSVDTFIKTAIELEIFAERSLAAREMLGMTDGSPQNVRALCALGEFLELIMKTGIDLLPDELLSAGVYRSAKTIRKACEILSELRAVSLSLGDVSDRITSVSCRELYAKWRDGENNLFIKNSIAHEVRKYLPSSSKLSLRDVGEKLELLAKAERLENEFSKISDEASIILGDLWDGKNTDIDRAGRIAEFAISADACIKRLFREENTADIHSKISKLISLITEDKKVNSDFVLAISAFIKLAGNGNGKGLLGEVSDLLCLDLYEIEFENGVFGEAGLAKMLYALEDSFDILSSLHEYNRQKKAAYHAGIGSFAEHIERYGISENTGALFEKSIYHAFASYIISSKKCFSNTDIASDYTNYRNMYRAEKELAAYNLISTHHEKFVAYVSSDAGKSELYALRESLADKALTPYELLIRHSRILNAMYCAIFAVNTTAYRLSTYPSVLVMLDCEKTDAAEGLPLCVNFDKCIFVSSPFERAGNILSSLPLGIPVFKPTAILSEKNGYIGGFVSNVYFDGNLPVCRSQRPDSISFIKCSGGLYDKNSRANKIEAIKVCENAFVAAEKYGFDNVGIIAMTPSQTSEIMSALLLLSKKYSDDRISKIPARFIGNMGDLSKDCIILSATFGKNIYSVTRSFGIADDVNLLMSGTPIVFSELLCAKNELRIVSSVEPEELMTDNLCKGASAYASLLSFAKYHTLPFVLNTSGRQIKNNGIQQRLEKKLRDENGGSNAVYFTGNTVSWGNRVIIYDNEYMRDTYERIILPHLEYSKSGYRIEYVSICDIIKNCDPTAQ